jgi:hypothetical protein
MKDKQIQLFALSISINFSKTIPPDFSRFMCLHTTKITDHLQYQLKCS